MSVRISDHDAERIRKLERKVNNIRGPGVSHTPDGIIINQPSNKTDRRSSATTIQPASFLVVALIQDGGSDGYEGDIDTAPTYCTYTYTIKDPATNKVLARNVPVSMGRTIAVETYPATWGLAVVDGPLGDAPTSGIGVPKSTANSSSSENPPNNLRIWYTNERWYQSVDCVIPPYAASSSSEDDNEVSESDHHQSNNIQQQSNASIEAESVESAQPVNEEGA